MFFCALEQAILEAVVYHDIFSYPMTEMEIWQSIRIKASFADVGEALRSSELLKKKLSYKNGMWFLRPLSVSSPRGGAPPLGDERASRYRASKHKLNKARRFAYLTRWLPCIQAVYVCNSLGYLNTRPENDIDLFIIVKAGRIWTGRLFAILLAELLGFRPKKENTRDGLCLSFFAADNADMKGAALEKDIYYLYWMSKLLPLFLRGDAQEKFWERNSWVRRELPQAAMTINPRCFTTFTTPSPSIKPPPTPPCKGGERGEMTEKILRALQIRLMPPYLKDAANKNKGVIINDKFLKFHDHDRREYFRDEFERRLAEAGR